jgi:hypothetical protein
MKESRRKWFSAFGKAEIQFLEIYTGDFQITFKNYSKLHNNVFSAINKGRSPCLFVR